MSKTNNGHRLSRFKITPVRLSNGIVVNQILLKRILSKLKKCKDIEVVYSDTSVIFNYSTNRGKGQFMLKDISDYISTEDIPLTDLLDDKETKI